MVDLYITHAHPNPAGKDRTLHGAPSVTKLNEEWIQFRNDSGRELDMNGVRLLHQTFNQFCQATDRREVTSFEGGFAPGYSWRIHTGSGTAHWEGAVQHLYLGRANYLWNNACGDTATLINPSGIVIDTASYAPRPPEGTVLLRQAGTNLLR